MHSRQDDAVRIFNLAKRLRDEHSRYARIAARAASSPKQHQKNSVDLNYQARAINEIEAELHAACVDAGLADLREPEHYAERSIRPDAWHEYRWQPPKPRALSDA